MAYIERDIFINNELIPLVKRLDLCHPKQKKGVLMAISKLKEAPVADVVEVRHGKWVMRGGRFRCSECDGKALMQDVGGTGGFSHEFEQVKSNICPHCGAKMDGKEEK